MNMNMNNPRVEFTFNTTQLSPSLGLVNSFVIFVTTKTVEIRENQTTGHRTENSLSPPVRPSYLNFSLDDLSDDHIHSLLHNRLESSHRWLRDDLTSVISRAATTSGFGRNGFRLTIKVTITHETVVVVSDFPPSNNESLLRMVLLRKIGREELKSMKMETEPCSICLDDLSCSKHGDPTRMTCSHVFHGCCLVEWLKRKNTCPMCRTVLHDL